MLRKNLYCWSTFVFWSILISQLQECFNFPLELRSWTPRCHCVDPSVFHIEQLKLSEYCLNLDIWKHGFMTTKWVLDWNWHLGEQLLPSHRILEQEIASMDAMEAINHPIGAKLLWILNSTDHFQERSSVINEVWKKRKQISEVQKSLTSWNEMNHCNSDSCFIYCYFKR